MQNKNWITVIIAVFLLSSCTITKSRYGNGYSIEIPTLNRGSNKVDLSTKEHKKSKKYPKVKPNLETDQSPKDTSCVQLTEKIELQFQKDAPLAQLSEQIRSFKKNKYDSSKLKSYIQKPLTIHHRNKTKNSKIEKSSHKQTTVDNDSFFGYLIDMLIAAFISAMVIGLLVALIISFLNPAVLEILEIVFAIIGLIVCLII